jgi:hypothetical protein
MSKDFLEQQTEMADKVMKMMEMIFEIRFQKLHNIFPKNRKNNLLNLVNLLK